MIIPVITGNTLPAYETEFSAGMDVRADFGHIVEKFLFNTEIIRVDSTYEDEDGLEHNIKVIDSLVINPGGRALIPTDLRVAIPEGYEIQVRPRSGLALKNGITVLNTPGTIDSDYRGEIGVIVINHGTEPFTIHAGDRIAQLVLNKVERIEWRHVDELPETARSEGGFGSTGK